MVDSISGTGGTNLVDPSGNLSQDAVSGNFEGVIGQNSSLGPDALALLKAQQKMSQDMQVYETLSKLIEMRQSAEKTAIQSVRA
jgi:hypothetical protein